MMGRPPISTLFPYTTLFRSAAAVGLVLVATALAVTYRVATGAPAGLFAVGAIAVLTALVAGVTRAPQDGALSIAALVPRSEEHTSELQSRLHLVCRLLLEKK